MDLHGGPMWSAQLRGILREMSRPGKPSAEASLTAVSYEAGDATHHQRTLARCRWGHNSDEPKIAEAMPGQDAVVSALGRRDTFSSDYLIEPSMRAIMPSMGRAGARRLTPVSAFGVGESHRNAPSIPRIRFRVPPPLLSRGARTQHGSQRALHRRSAALEYVRIDEMCSCSFDLLWAVSCYVQ